MSATGRPTLTKLTPSTAEFCQIAPRERRSGRRKRGRAEGKLKK